MVGAGNRDVPAPHPALLLGVLGEELGDRAPTPRVEEAVPVLSLEEQGGESRHADVDHEIDVEARRDCLARNAPLRYQRCLGVPPIEPAADLLPQLDGLLVPGIVLDQRSGHVDPKAGGPLPQPEIDDLLELGSHRPGTGCVDWLLPRDSRIRPGEAVVERRLAVEEVDGIGAVALGIAVDESERGSARIPGRPGPDVVVGEAIAPVSAGGLEPGVLDRRVSRDQIETDPDVAAPRLLEQAHQVGVRPVAGSHLVVVRYVVAGILEGRDEAGVDPYGIHAELAQIVELPNDAGDVTDAIAVRIVEALRVDLIEDGVFQPFRSRCGSHGSAL